MERKTRRISPSILVMAALVFVLIGVLAAALSRNVESTNDNNGSLLVGDNSSSSITIHFKQTSEDTPHIYYENVNGSGEEAVSYPGLPMKADGDGWCTYTIDDASSADVILSVPNQAFRTVVTSRTEGEYWYDEGYWYDEKPNTTDIYATKLTVKDSGTYDLEGNLLSESTDAAEYMSSTGVDTGITIHYKNDNWDDIRMYYWNTCPVDSMSSENGVSLTPETGEDAGWYKYTFDDATKANFFFFSGKEQTEDFSLRAGEWWFDGRKWTTKKPGQIKSGQSLTGDMREESVYFMITTRFYDGDSGNNKMCWDNKFDTDANPQWKGDFKGLAEKLDYLKALGFSAIWITPVVDNASGFDYHGYHAYNFMKVDERYESDDFDYADLISACHEKGIKVIQDVVYNHSGNFGEANIFPIFVKEDSAKYKGTLQSPMMELGGNYVSILEKAAQEVYGGSYESLIPDNQYRARIAAFKDYAASSDHVYHSEKSMEWEAFVVQTGQIAGDCVDLNTENPKVAAYLRDAYTGYINMGVDAFRVDTVKHISRITLNKEFNPQLTEAYQKHNSVDEEFYMVGEICAKYRGNVFNSAIPAISGCFYTWKEEKEYSWGSDQAANIETTKLHWADNCKVDGQRKSNNAFLNGVTYHKPDTSQASGMYAIDFLMHYSFLTAQEAWGSVRNEGSGYGDSAYNDSTYNLVYVDSHDYGPDGQESMRYNGGEEAWAENMALMWTFRGIPCIYYGSEVQFKAGVTIDQGPNLALENSGRAYFGDHIVGDVTASDFGVYKASGTVAETLNNPLALHVQRLNMIRRAVPALQKGQYTTDGAHVDGNMAYIRRYTDGSEDSLALVTISSGATFKGIPNGKYVDCVTGDVQNVTNGTLSASCSGRGNMRVYVLNGPGKIGTDGKYLK